jgi:phosphatidate cytidylyltransferase
MAKAGGQHPLTPLGMAGGLMVAGLQFFGASGAWLGLGVAGWLMILLIRLLLDAADLKGAASRGAITLLGVVYVAGLLSFSALLRGLDDGITYIFYLTLVTWAGDIGAFYVGTALGKRPLYPAISPHKTVEGGLGGLACSVLASCAARLWFWERLGVVQTLSLGIGLGVMGQVGDLCESMLKRGFGVKDAGALIPGHGGILDRIDSLLFTGPVLYLAVVSGWVCGGVSWRWGDSRVERLDGA